MYIMKTDLLPNQFEQKMCKYLCKYIIYLYNADKLGIDIFVVCYNISSPNEPCSTPGVLCNIGFSSETHLKIQISCNLVRP